MGSQRVGRSGSRSAFWVLCCREKPLEADRCCYTIFVQKHSSGCSMAHALQVGRMGTRVQYKWRCSEGAGFGDNVESNAEVPRIAPLQLLVKPV